jgi:TolB-like protein
MIALLPLAAALHFALASPSSPTASSPTASSPTASSPSSPNASSPATTSVPSTAVPADARPRVLVLDVVGDLDDSTRATLTALLTTRLARFKDLDVTARSSLARLVDVEADKQVAGCGDNDAGCLAELAGALDVDYVAVATAGRIGGTTVFTLQLIDRAGKTSGRGTAQVSALDGLAGRVAAVADDVGQQVTGVPPPSGAASFTGGGVGGGRIPAGWQKPMMVGGGAGVGVGVLSLALGLTPAVLYGNAAGDLRSLRARYVDAGGDRALVDEAGELQKRAIALQGMWNNVGIYAAWGGILVGVAGGAALAAALLFEEAP